jgi:23S rRNA pseudouridine2605 synthase
VLHGLFYFCRMKKKTGFEKFISKEKKGAAKKEQIRQEKKQITKERKEYFEKKRQEKREGVSSAVPGTRKPAITKAVEEKMPLNKYIAHSGVCSRRDAVDIIKKGKVKINGEVVTEPGHKVLATDSVIVNGKKINPVKDLVYILLNKPKDYITTTEDERGRKTVLDLIKKATTTKVYPVGRLDRNTSGVLLLTNDGELTQKLTHPSNEIKKLYAVTLDKPLAKAHFDEILKGVPLEDGMAHVDVLAYTDNADKTQIGVELHSGRNRIVRRIFEHFGYDVKNLDRVIFAGLTKKNVDRGKWRFLSEKEVRDLKYFGKGK